MGACIFKQPNGLYGRYSATIDTITHINMTEEDYINVCLGRKNNKAYREYGRSDEWIRKDALDTLENHLYDYEDAIETFKAYSFDIYDEEDEYFDDFGEWTYQDEYDAKAEKYFYCIEQMNNTVNPKFEKF